MEIYKKHTVQDALLNNIWKYACMASGLTSIMNTICR